MGIHGLMKLLSEEAPGSIKEVDFTALTGRKVAIDASMAMYQFLVAVRVGGQGAQMNLTNSEGEVTSHIQGMFNRTIKMMETGIKPVYIFDGKPPQLKGGELAKRMAKRAKAETDLTAAKEAGEGEDVDRFNRRLVKVSRQHSEDCKQLLKLMGIPTFDAPCEAEAQCAELAKKGKVYATATEDMDALTFRTPKLLRKLTYSQGAQKGKDGKTKEKQPVLELDVEKVLSEMGLSYEQFVDLCILCGCDYCSSIKGIGPKTALALIREHKNIEGLLKALRYSKKKFDIPPDWKEQRVSKKAMALAEEEARERREKAEQAKEEGIKTMNATFSPGKSTYAASSSSSSSSEAVMQVDDKAAKEAAADIAGEGASSSTASSSSGSSSSSSSSSEAAAGGEAGAADADADGDGEGEGLGDVPDMPEEEEEPAEEEVSLQDLAAGGMEEDDEDSKMEETSLIDEDDVEVIPPLFVQARKLFIQAEVFPAETIDLKWEAPDVAGLTDFLVNRMQFDPKRVATGIKKLSDAQAKKTQGRMDSFFTAVANPNAGVKRKAEEPKGKGKAAAKGSKPFAKKR